MFKSSFRAGLAFTIACFYMGLDARVANATVDMIFTPSFQTVASGQIVEITLSVQSNQPTSQQFSGLDAILIWDPAHLQFLNFDTTGAGYPWFQKGFFPNPDGLNITLTDGDGQFTVLASPGTPAVAPPAPATLVVAKFRFTAAAGTAATTLSLSPAEGTFSETRVLGPTSGTIVTGDISSVATVTIIEPCSPSVGDVDGDTFYTYADIAAAVDVYLEIDTIPAHIVAADANCDGFVDGRDLQPLVDYLLLVL